MSVGAIRARPAPVVAAPEQMVAWGQHLAACLAVAVAGGALAVLTGTAGWWLLVVIATMLAVVSATFGWRTNHRRRTAAAALVITQQELSNVSRIAWQVVLQGWLCHRDDR